MPDLQDAKIGTFIAVIGVIIAIFAWLFPAPLQKGSPVPSNIPEGSNLFDKNPLYTISSGSVLKALQDIYLPAYKEIIYIQKGKFILDKEKVDENDYLAILKLNRKSSTTRRISSGNSFDIKDSGRHGPEDREYRHTYVYLIINNNDIDHIKFLGINNTEYMTIGQFRSIMKGIVDLKIPVPQEI